MALSGIHRRSAKPASAVLGTVLVAILLAACTPSPTANVYFSEAGRATVIRLTAGTGSGGRPTAFRVSRTANRMKISAPRFGASGNQRSVAVPAGERMTRNQAQCVRWDYESRPVNQVGVALHLRPSTNGAWSGITITKNVWGNATWVFNVHEWNQYGAEPGLSGLHPMAQFSMYDAIGSTRRADGSNAVPWNLCGAVIGTTLFIKVWPSGVSEPSWLDPKYARNLPLPHHLQHPGYRGIYAGHLASGEFIHYSKIWS